MKICIFAHTLDDKTGTGELVGNIMKGVSAAISEYSFIALTSENLLKPDYFFIAKNWLKPLV